MLIHPLRYIQELPDLKIEISQLLRDFRYRILLQELPDHTAQLEKIQKKTGLDVRVFDDALTFKIAMMVADHMKYINN